MKVLTMLFFFCLYLLLSDLNVDFSLFILIKIISLCYVSFYAENFIIGIEK